MAYVIEIKNPFEPLKDVKKSVHAGGISILDWLQLEYPGFKEFETATICVVNGQPVMRKDWDQEIEKDDIVNFIALPGDPFTIIAIIIVVAVIALSLVMYLTTTTPTTPGEQPASDPVFSVKGQQNAIRLGEPIEACYGRNRIYPSLAQRPFYQYRQNDQFQYSLFCLGQGQFEISDIQIGDTAIENYEEVEWEVILPGAQVTLFPTNVITSVEAGGQTLFAPNEDEYSGDGYVGPFATNPSSTEVVQVQVDLIFPKGLYGMGDDGSLYRLVITVQIQARLIDDLGDPLGDWFDLPDDSDNLYSLSAATTTPQRRTLKYVVPSGRYEVRVRRVDNKYISARAGHDVVWEGLRGFVEEDADYGDVTLLAVAIRASNNLNNRTASLFNVICTRKLMIGSVETSTVLAATRSIVWAFVDVFRSTYGGRITEAYFDWDALEVLDALYESRDEHFDWCFRDPITVWEAARTIARVGRGTPLLNGSMITLKREGPLELPVTFFSQENITKGSFKWQVKLWDIDEFDGISVEYTEPLTGYKQEHVIAVLPGEAGDNPQDVRLVGIQDRAHAYREGLFLRAQQRYLRENITIDTGLEGHIPTFGDLIAICHDTPRWGQGGIVVNASRETGDDYLLFVSEPLRYEETGEYQILLRGRQGEVVGPFTATEMDDPKQVMITITDSGDFDFLLTGKTEPMLFLFGPTGEITKLGKVVKIEPQGGEGVRITAVNDAPIIHSFDELEPPPLEIPVLPLSPPDLPVVTSLDVTQMSGDLGIVQAAWTAAFGANYYIVQTSYDGENWEDRGTTQQTSIQLQVRPGDLWVRVAAVGSGQGPWIEDTLTIATEDPDLIGVTPRLSILPPGLKDTGDDDGLLVAMAKPEGSSILATNVFFAYDPDLTYTQLGVSQTRFPAVGTLKRWHEIGTGNWLVRVEFTADDLAKLEGYFDSPGTDIYAVVGERDYKSVGSSKDEHQVLAPWLKITDGGIFDTISATARDIEIEGGEFGSPDLLLETLAVDGKFPTVVIYFGRQTDFFVYPTSDIYFERLGANATDDDSMIRYVKVPGSNYLFEEAMADVTAVTYDRDLTTMSPEGTFSQEWGARAKTTYEIFDEQGGLLAANASAPDYSVVSDIDEALAAVVLGTATAEQGILVSHIDGVLGKMSSTEQRYYNL